MHRGNRNKHSPMTVTHCLFTNNDTNFEIQNNMPSLKEQQREMKWMFASLLDELYDIMDKLSYIKWELANGQNPTVNDDLIFDLIFDPFRTIGRFWKLHCQLYCFSFYFILMSLQLSPLELTRLIVMPGVTDKMAQIFQNQPLFILGLWYFTYTSQHIDRLEREVEQARHEQAFLFDRIVEDGFEQKIRPLVIRNRRWLICCQNCSTLPSPTQSEQIRAVRADPSGMVGIWSESEQIPTSVQVKKKKTRCQIPSHSKSFRVPSRIRADSDWQKNLKILVHS